MRLVFRVRRFHRLTVRGFRAYSGTRRAADVDIGHLSPVWLESRRWLASLGRYGTLEVVSLRMKDSACRISP
jgi:hypothetical protein